MFRQRRILALGASTLFLEGFAATLVALVVDLKTTVSTEGSLVGCPAHLRVFSLLDSLFHGLQGVSC